MPYVRKTKRRPSVKRKLRIIAIVCAALAAVLIVGGFALKQHEIVTQYSAEAESFNSAVSSTNGTALDVEADETTTTVAFLGDSYTQGAGTDNASKSFALVAAKTLGWDGEQFAVGGSGYINGGDNSFVGRVDDVVAAGPDMVVVAGSRNDMAYGYDAVYAAADQVYTEIRTDLPDAELVVVGPMWTSNDVPAEILAVNDAVRDAAEAHDAVFIDTLSPSWLDGNPELLAEDGVHPSEAGHAVLAEHFTEAIQEAGL